MSVGPTRAGSDDLEETRASLPAEAGAHGTDSDADEEGDPRLVAAVQEYMAAIEAGRRPNHQELLERYPDIAGELAACIQGLAFVHSAAAQIRPLPGPAAGAGPGDDDSGDEIGATARPLGDFKLVREIGRGGMGVVYEAVQLSLGRRVAVKVLPMAAALDTRHLERFRNEAQAAAQLHHTNIVPVYAVGCERSVHFYAMQLIDGRSLADVIRTLRETSGRARGDAGKEEDGARGRGGEGVKEDGGTGGQGDGGIREDAETRGRGDAETTGSRSASTRSGAAGGPPSDATDATDAGTRGRGDAETTEPVFDPEAQTRRGASATGSGAHGTGTRGRVPGSLKRSEGLSGSGNVSAVAPSLSSLHSSKPSAYFRSVARIGVQAAEALDYAHQLGVVHRDIKPANLLLDGRGNLWVTDFGLAQMYADTGLTRTGDLVGTFRYMSPEQASGRAVVLDQRTDVYSLGVTLYELLTLERALPGETREQLLDQIRYHEPRPPRSIDKAIPRELEVILAKATAKDAGERYPTARALADDLLRFLEDQPILARPPSLWNKAAKWTRRHRALAVSALAMLLLAAVGLLVSTLLIAREQARTKAAYVLEQRKAAEASDERLRADQRYKQARDAVDFFTRIAAEELDGPQTADVRKEMLEAALAYYEGFLDERRDDPSITAELSAAEAKVLAILTELSAVDEFGRVSSRSRLLNEPSVRSALQLSAAQVADLQGSRGRLSEQVAMLPDLRHMPTEERRQRLAKAAGEIEAAIGRILTPAQAERLRQIDRQVRGPLAFSDPQVMDALALTREQKESVRAAQNEFRDTRHRGGPGGPGGPRGHGPSREADDAQAAAAQAAAVRKILALLTPVQLGTWKSLTGEPFAGKVFSDDHPFGGPFGGGHGGGPHRAEPPPG